MAYWLGNIPGIGVKKIRALLRCFPDPESIWEADGKSLSQIEEIRKADAARILSPEVRRRCREEFTHLRDRGISYCPCWSERYPQSLRHIYQPPKHLYVKGKLPDETRLSIAIVGARDCSCYGRDMARLFGYRLSQAGVQVISGMALGIDGWGHQGALEGGGDTFAVLGSGVEVCYPPAHRRLYESIQKNGGVISELPPYMRAQSRFFPMRNRIISGLSQGILVVEARERSGSLITADAALEQGRDVFVVPGRIGDVLSQGCNRLIRQGAVPVLSPMDILEYYNMGTNILEGIHTPTEEKILGELGENPVHMDQILKNVGECRAGVFKAVMKLKSQGEIREVSRDYFVRMSC